MSDIGNALRGLASRHGGVLSANGAKAPVDALLGKFAAAATYLGGTPTDAELADALKRAQAGSLKTVPSKLDAFKKSHPGQASTHKSQVGAALTTAKRVLDAPRPLPPATKKILAEVSAAATAGGREFDGGRSSAGGKLSKVDAIAAAIKQAGVDPKSHIHKIPSNTACGPWQYGCKMMALRNLGPRAIAVKLKVYDPYLPNSAGFRDITVPPYSQGHRDVNAWCPIPGPTAQRWEGEVVSARYV